MFNRVKIGDKEVPMLSMASTDIYYRMIFHEDGIKLQASKDFDEGDMFNFIFRIGYVMAMQAQLHDRKELAKLNEDTFMDWLDQFSREDFADAMVDIKKTYEGQMVTGSEAKKNKDEPTDN